MGSFNLKRKASNRISIFRRCIFRVWNQMVVCSLGKRRQPVHYRMLAPPPIPSPPSSCEFSSSDNVGSPSPTAVTKISDGNKDSDLVSLKISLLGDSQIGKTSFLAKYVGREKEERGKEKDGIKMMDKTLMVEGARISFSLWEIEGDEGSKQQIPVACKDSVAILIMFDLTSRVTLNGVIRWYQEARKWNQSAIPILIGTKFDDFIQLPVDMQWTIASQARSYAKALNATLFFSSATYNINVNKIFKFITAKLFDLPWTPQRNLTIGEPIIDF